MKRIRSYDDRIDHNTSKRKKRHSAFPLRLYDMLEDAEALGYSHVISWMPDGTSFKIHVDGTQDLGDERKIVQALQRTFNMTRYRSFLRQLQLYGFERIYKGPHRGECKHKLFVRGRRDLLFEKSVEDFQRSDDDESDSPPNNARCVNELLAPESIFLKKDNSNYWMPSCAFLESTPNNGCEYVKSSVIPTTLANLNPYRYGTNSSDGRSDNRDVQCSHHRISEREEQNRAVGNDENQHHKKPAAIATRRDKQYDWMAFETEMLRNAM